MLQLTQKLKDGAMQVLEAPIPDLGPGMLMVQTYYSLISAGTEGSTVSAARKSLLGKAKERPEQARQVLNVVLSQGIVQAYRAVMKKLDAHSPLGYSCVGKVIGIGSGVNAFHVGDFVACGGLTACHAEVVVVPVNLCVKLAPDADLKQAAYNTLGAIAMQGVRQADMRLGETCVVIGLGLLGQLSCLLLRASGVHVIGIDVSQAMVDLAGKNCVDMAMLRSEVGVTDRIHQMTNGIGCDAVIITAATDSLDPINFAGAITRKRGRVVVVGSVPTGFDRDPHYYRKELELRMSCSYGPGRYDSEYEEKGHDYPPAYVRWTENRNMQAFQELIRTQKINVSYLTTHVFKLDEAQGAYDMIYKRTEPSVGILIEYDPTKELLGQPTKIVCHPQDGISRKVVVGVIGAGSYAQSHILPNIQGDDVELRGVMTATSAGARTAADRYGFSFCTGEVEDILNDTDINVVFIATRHNSHADYVLRALQAGKSVFVEKPLCLKLTELEEISALLRSLKERLGANAPQLMVGYNRRFSPFLMEVKKRYSKGAMAICYRVNSGAVPADAWPQDLEVGGGRILGEVCHFVDVLTYLTGSQPQSVYATAMPVPGNLNDTLQVCLRYADGSVCSIAYLANGDKSLAKERVEIFSHGTSIIIDDFKSMFVHEKGKVQKKKLLSQDKGQKTEISAFVDAVRNAGAEVIPFAELYSTSLVTFAIIQSLQSGESVQLSSLLVSASC